MGFPHILAICLLLQAVLWCPYTAASNSNSANGLSSGSEEDVAESDGGGGGGGPQPERGGAQDRDDSDLGVGDQLAMETVEHEAPSHAYNGPPPPPALRHPNHPIGLPRAPNGNGHHGLLPPSSHSKGPFGHGGPHKPSLEHGAYRGPPPPPPQGPKQIEAMDKLFPGGNDIWPAPVPEMPKIISLDVKCEKNGMRVFLSFDKPFYGIVFSKGHYSNLQCVHLPAGLGRTSANFDIGIRSCGTAGNTENGLYGYGPEAGSGTYFENIVVIQYDPQVQEVWDQARKLRCTWHDQYEKSVTFRPFPVDMLDVVRADFAGDNVGCWMQIQVGKGPWASEVSGLVKIGQTMTMVLAIKDDDAKFDMLVRNCMAHDGKRAPIQLVDQRGCVTRPKLMSRFTKIKNFGASASVLSYAHFQAFKFPDSMEVHFQCTIQICRYRCPEQCSESGAAGLAIAGPHDTYGPPQHPLDAYLHAQARDGKPRDERRVRRYRRTADDPEKEVGLNRVIRVVSTGDLTFSLDDNSTTIAPTMVFPGRPDGYQHSMICMTTPGFAATLGVLLAALVAACIASAVLCLKLRPIATLNAKTVAVSFTNPQLQGKKTSKSCFYS